MSTSTMFQHSPEHEPSSKTEVNKNIEKRCFPRQEPLKPDILDMADNLTSCSNISPVGGRNGSLSDMGYMSSENYNFDVAGFDESSINLSIDSSDDLLNVSMDQNKAQEGTDDDSILNQFDSYFRRKLEMELQTFQNCMHSMLSEQQLHFRNIITSTQAVIKIGLIRMEGFKLFCQAFMSYLSLQENFCTKSKDLEPSGEDKRPISRCPCQCQSPTTSRSKWRLMVELMALNCRLSALLSTPKFWPHIE